ncbi:MAG: hypothetical protein QM644_18860 [Mobilitalea sp.]
MKSKLITKYNAQTIKPEIPILITYTTKPCGNTAISFELVNT